GLAARAVIHALREGIADVPRERNGPALRTRGTGQDEGVFEIGKELRPQLGRQRLVADPSMDEGVAKVDDRRAIADLGGGTTLTFEREGDVHEIGRRPPLARMLADRGIGLGGSHRGGGGGGGGACCARLGGTRRSL